MDKIDVGKVKEWWEKGGKKKEIAVILVVIAAVALAVMAHLLRQYEDYNVRASTERIDSAETDYLDFQGNILKYNRDGAFYTDYDGELIWNYTYEMESPQAQVCGNSVLIYDRDGTQLTILSVTGVEGNVTTSLPILDADVSANGTTAVLMQNENTGYVEIYDLEGQVLASGELHGENSGIPVALALSSDGQKLMISMIDLNGGNVKTTIAFYDFGREGEDAIDNLVASYSYSDMVIPQIDFVKNDKAIAFGDSEIVIFRSNSRFDVDNEIFFQDQIKSIFYNDDYFGVVRDAAQEDGSLANQMTVYNMSGYEVFETVLDISYNDIELMSNNEIVISNGKDVNIYTMQGIKKFAYSFETSIYKIIPGRGSRRYIFLEQDVTELVTLT